MRAVFAVSLIALVAAALYLTMAGPSSETMERVTPRERQHAARAPRPQQGKRQASLDEDEPDTPVIALRGLPTGPARYRLTYEASWTLQGQKNPPIEMEMHWDVHPVEGGQRIQISEARITDHPALPMADSFNGIYGLKTVKGLIRRLETPQGADQATRRTFAELATVFWLTERAEQTWVVEEEHPTGPFKARYARVDQAIEKTPLSVLAVRGPEGLDPQGARGLTPGGLTRFEFDRRGITWVEVDTTMTVQMGEGSPEMTSRIKARLVRLNTPLSALAAVSLETSSFDSLVDYQGQALEQDMKLLDGATVEDLVAGLSELDALPRRGEETRNARSLLLRQISALVRVQPEAAPMLAEALVGRARAGKDTGVLAGGLASAGAEGTNALASALPDLQGPARHNALSTLSLADVATEESMDALTTALVGGLEEGQTGDHEHAAALALGAQARSIASDSPEAASSAVELLIQRYLGATSPTERRAYLRALGNTGDVEALPFLMAIIESDDLLRPDAIYGLRFIPSDAVDVTLEPLVKGLGADFEPALGAVTYRSPQRWSETLTTLQSVLLEVRPDDQRSLAIAQVLSRWQ